MRKIHKIFGIFFLLQLFGCSLSMPDFGNSNTAEINNQDYNKVLNDNYNGYNDDDELDSSSINRGANSFAECSNSTECSLLWDTAKVWLTEKSFYKSKLKTNTENYLETEVDPRKRKADKITFEVTRLPNGKTNIIKINASCPKNCKSYINKEFFAFNSFLKNHLLAYQNGIIDYAQVENKMKKEFESSDSINIDVSDLTSKPRTYVLDENELQGKIDVTETKNKRYIGKVAESLIDDHSCHKQSEINLIKKSRKRELYEVNCIKEVKRMIFDCSPSGCEVLQ